MKVPKTIRVGSLEYRIVFVGDKKMRKVSGVTECEGYVDEDGGVIYLNKRLKRNPTRLVDTLVHEAVGHIVFDACGIGYWMKSQVKTRSNQKWVEFQEALVRIYTPAIISTLRSLGFLKDK